MNGLGRRNAVIAEWEAKRRALLDEYMTAPFDGRARDTETEDELTRVEELLLQHPPAIEDERGNVREMGRGLVEPTEADFAALEAVQKPMRLEEAGIQVIPESEWSSYIAGHGGEEAVFADRNVPGITNQGSVGSCGSEGVAGASMTVRVASGQPPVMLNPWFLYQEVSGGVVDRGSTLQANMAKMLRDGCASAEVWPRSHGWRTRPSAAAFEDAKKYRLRRYVQVRNWAEFGTMLLLGWPVYFGYVGHAIYASRLLSASQLQYVNSWGANWGQNGRGTLSRNSIYWSYGAYALTSIVHSTEPSHNLD